MLAPIFLLFFDKIRQNSTKYYGIVTQQEREDIMQAGIILDGDKLKAFYEKINIKYKPSKLLIKINDNKAEYYNFEEDCFYDLDVEVAKKYI